MHVFFQPCILDAYWNHLESLKDFPMPIYIPDQLNLKYQWSGLVKIFENSSDEQYIHVCGQVLSMPPELVNLQENDCLVCIRKNDTGLHVNLQDMDTSLVREIVIHGMTKSAPFKGKRKLVCILI